MAGKRFPISLRDGAELLVSFKRRFREPCIKRVLMLAVRFKVELRKQALD